MNTRLKQFLAAENITQAQFADNIEVVRASVSHVLSGRNNPSYDFIRSIMQKYPKLNIEWLMFGKGKMYKDSDYQEEPAQVSPVIKEEPLLFEPEVEVEENFQPTFDINTLVENHQSAINQRKVKKIIILFDDGSYQEM